MPVSPEAVKSDINLPSAHLLSDQEFLDLIFRYRNGDRDAKNIIIQHNLRLVMSVAQRFTNRLELDDLFQIGCMGLMKAIEKFNPAYGVKFSTYAVPVIIGEIKQHLRDDGPIKISRNLKEIAVKVEQIRNQLANQSCKEPTLSELETASGFSREEIAAALEATRPINSLQEIVHEEEGEAIYREQLVGEETAHSRWLEQFALQEVIRKLPERLQKLVRFRYYEGKTQSEIAAIFGVSQVQVCRLEKEALHRLRNLYLSE